MPTARLSRQRGAAALFAAIATVGMLMASAFAIDVAQLHLAKRDLQNMGNLAALDTARAAGGCLAPDLDRQATANAVTLASLGRLGGEAAWLEGSKVDLGRFVIDADTSVREFQLAAEDEVGSAYAFEVDLQRPFPNLLLPFPGVNVDGAQLTAKSSAAMAPVGSFSVGSFLLSVSPTEQSVLNDLFGGILGSPLNIAVLSYQGLVNASVKLESVAEELGKTLDELDNEPVTLSGLLSGLANVLFDAGEAAAADAVSTLAAAAPNDLIIVGDLIESPSGTITGVGQAGVSAMQLVRAAVMQTAGPVFSITPSIVIPGIASANVDVSVLQVPTVAVGSAFQDSDRNYLTHAENSQAQVDLNLQLLDIAGYGVAVDLQLVAAQADGELLEIRCADPARSNHEVDIGVKTSIAQLNVNNGPANPVINIALLGTAICWQGTVNLGTAGDEVLTFVGPFDPDDPVILADNTQTAGTDLEVALGQGLADLIADSPPYVCGPVGPLIDPIVNPILATLSGVLGPVLGATGDSLLEPLLEALGVELGGADVTVRDVFVAPPALIYSD